MSVLEDRLDELARIRTDGLLTEREYEDELLAIIRQTEAHAKRPGPGRWALYGCGGLVTFLCGLVVLSIAASFLFFVVVRLNPGSSSRHSIRNDDVHVSLCDAAVTTRRARVPFLHARLLTMCSTQTKVVRRGTSDKAPRTWSPAAPSRAIALSGGSRR